MEGRALEHELAGQGGFVIRMKDAGGKFIAVSGPVARQIRSEMRERVGRLLLELAGQGLHTRGADCAVLIGEETRSVDLRLWSSHHKANALVEVK